MMYLQRKRGFKAGGFSEEIGYLMYTHKKSLIKKKNS